MENLFDYALLAFTSLFTMLNPLGVIPMYTGLTVNLPQKETKQVAIKASITAGLTLIMFALAGNLIFDFFGVSVNSLRIVGGVIFFMVGFDMLQAAAVRTKDSGESNIDYATDIAITPLAIPLISGPGAITASIVLFNDAGTISHKIILLCVIVLNLVIVLIALLSSRKIVKLLGESGNKVLMRIMGLIVMVIAVEFLFSGLKPVIRDILKIP